MDALSPKKNSLLQSVHLYPKVPKDLTDATRLGGALSLACAGLMAYLFISNIAAYLQMTTTTDVALDDTGDVEMRLFFNVTMVSVKRAPSATLGCLSALPVSAPAASLAPIARARAR